MGIGQHCKRILDFRFSIFDYSSLDFGFWILDFGLGEISQIVTP